jgi:predicted solute-binding protein
MALHKDLTGAELHEPKGADSAAAGTVYVADGSGSGDWTPAYEGIFILNQYWMSGEITDISTPSSHAYIYVPVDSEMFELAAILSTGITTANAVLSIYVNGVLFADTLTVTQAGSTAGQLSHVNITTANSIPAGSVVEIRSNGASDTVSAAYVSLGLRALG